MLLSGCTAWAQTGPPRYGTKSLRLDGSMGLSERNYTARDSMVVDSLKRRLIGGNTGARVAAANALADVPSSSLTCFSGNYVDLTNKPVLFSGNYTDLTNKPVLFSGNYADLTNKPVLFSGCYTDLTCRPTIPTSMSGLVNDADYQTGAQVRTAIHSVADTLSASLVATTSTIKSVSATATQALALAQANQGGTTTSYTIQYRATNVNTASGTSQTLTHNFGANTGIDRIVAYEVNTRVSVDMPFDTSSVTDTQVTIQPLVTTIYTAIIVTGHKLQ